VLTGFKLEDGTEVKTPWLDGVLERAMLLFDEWVEQKPELVRVPESILLLQAIVAVDVKRMLDGFKKGGIEEGLARAKVHSHLNERLMNLGIAAFFAQFSFSLDQASNHWPVKGDPLAPPTEFGFGEPLSEDDLKKSSEFGGMMDMIGEDATEHLLKAYLVFDHWFRKLYKEYYKDEEKKPKQTAKKKTTKKAKKKGTRKGTKKGQKSKT